MPDRWNIEVASVDTNGNAEFEGTVTAKQINTNAYTVATLPSAVEGGTIYVSDGAAGSAILAFSDGTDWLRSDTGAAVSAT